MPRAKASSAVWVKAQAPPGGRAWPSERGQVDGLETGCPKRSKQGDGIPVDYIKLLQFARFLWLDDGCGWSFVLGTYWKGYDSF